MKNQVAQQDWFRGHQKEQQHKIVVHIHRGDVTPCFRLEFGYICYLPNSYYMALIETYRQEDSEVTIFSESQSFENWTDLEVKGYKLVLDGDMSNVWKEAIDSNVFIMSRSSFSYVPAVLARGIVVYTEFWHQPLQTWDIVNNESLWNKTLNELNAMRSNCTNMRGRYVK